MVASLFPQHSMNAIRLGLMALAIFGLSRVEADPQGERTIAMEEIRMAAQAEVLAAGCGRRLNEQLRDMPHPRNGSLLRQLA
jgi:hypothetical protein